VTPGVGIVTPTKVGIVTPTPVVSKNVTPGAVTGGTGACPPTYTVRSGDNLFRIALKFNLTISAIAAVNKITNPDLLSVGTVLTLPCGGAASTTGGTGSTTTTTSGGTKPLAGDTVDKNGDILHTVKSGENLFRIALAYNLSWQEVAAYNGITQPNQLVIGQVIRIPTK
jgi:LysM repeat protein